ncbi:FAD-linked oxidase C-terminal domain-containing protein [Planctomycetota bacterium]
MADTSSKIRSQLDKRIQGDVFTDILHRVAYSIDASIYRIVPQCVVFPRSVEDIQAVLHYAADRGLAVAPRGAGSGVAGESLCDGIVLDMTRYMKRIEYVDPQAGEVTCEPGAVLEQLNASLALHGQQIGPDPSSANRATVGGCVANNATGAHSLVYGHMAAYVTAMDTVLADGSHVSFHNDMPLRQGQDTRAHAVAGQCLDILSRQADVIQEAQPATRRNRSGYTIADVVHDETIDMARLLTGSEGTLGIFTKLRLRTVPIPRARGLLQLAFSSLEAMSEAVPIIVTQNASACELMDQSLLAKAIEALPQYRDILPDQAAALLLVEQVADSPDAVRGALMDTVAAVGDRVQSHQLVLDTQQQQRLWKSRKDAVPLLYRDKGRQHPVPFIEDVSVPHTRLGDYLRGLAEIGKQFDTPMSYYGHAGDGELHVRPYLDLHDPDHVKTMQALAEAVFSLAWSLGGSISGEHADGLVRAGFVRRQYGEAYYQVLKDLKNTFDPQGLLNPGKILNDDPDIMVKNLRRSPALVAQRLQSPLQFEDNELAHELFQCNGCGLCRSENAALRMCPVFRALGDELGTSRAKINVLDYWMTGQLQTRDYESREFRHFLDLCINCRACQQQCPSGVDTAKLMGAVRAQYTQRRHLRRGEWVLSNNRFLSRAGAALAPVSNLCTRLPLVGWVMEKTIGLDRRRRLPSFAQGAFLPMARRYLLDNEPVTEPVDRVVYFVDTFVNFHDHDLGYTVLDVLALNRIEVVLPKQRPAPLPAISYGHTRRARQDFAYTARHLLPWVEQGYTVICSEPSAALALKQETRHYLSRTQAQRLADHSMDLMDYLYRLYTQGALLGPSVALTDPYLYHQPCHREVNGPEQTTIRLLQQWGGADIRDLAAGCCGLAGTYGLQKKNARISQRMAQTLRLRLAEEPLGQVLTECAACQMQIEHTTGRSALHPIQVVARAYNLENAFPDE